MSEQIYDEQIAPLLLKASKICEANGMSMLAEVEYEPGELGRTTSIQPDACLSLKLACVAAACKNNVDNLIFWIMRYGREHGHSSACLNVLGVPTTPAKSLTGE